MPTRSGRDYSLMTPANIFSNLLTPKPTNSNESNVSNELSIKTVKNEVDQNTILETTPKPTNSNESNVSNESSIKTVKNEVDQNTILETVTLQMFQLFEKLEENVMTTISKATTSKGPFFSSTYPPILPGRESDADGGGDSGRRTLEFK